MSTSVINKELFLDINGIKQYVLICGTDTNKPILLMIHGGNPQTAYFKKYNAALEEHFLVVYWEQRGTGKSYCKTIDQDSITLENHTRRCLCAYQVFTKGISQR